MNPNNVNRTVLPRVSGLLLATCLLGAISTSGASAQDADAGEKVFKKCAACHAVGPDAKKKTGPALNGIMGAPAGQVEGFKYSTAMLESGLTWDEETLGNYLRDPKSVVPGTRMTFAGLKKGEDVANVIAYLAGFSPDGTAN